MAEDVERTEEPTAKRRTEARRQGQIAISQEAFIFANLFAVSLMLLFSGRHALSVGTATARSLWSPRSELDADLIQESLALAAGALITIVAPILVAALVSGVLAGQLQTRGNIASKRLQPRWSKLSPAANLSRIFKRQGLIDLPKSIAKIALAGAVIWFAVSDRLDDYLGLVYLPLVSIVGFQLGTVLHAYLAGCAVLLLIALVDYAYQHWQTEKSLKMTKTEVKEERKQSEGDPMVKSRQRSLQFERARSRMMEAVPKADVIVTNPTHISIALKYERSEMAAPRVLARGAGILALRIREIARHAGVPIVENPPLARALYRSARVGDVIPERLYRAVAEVLAYVYRMEPRRPRAW